MRERPIGRRLLFILAPLRILDHLGHVVLDTKAHPGCSPEDAPSCLALQGGPAVRTRNPDHSDHARTMSPSHRPESP